MNDEMEIIDKINMRIKRLEEFKSKAAESCGKKLYNIDWFDVDYDLFVEYNIDRRNIVSDPYYIGECIDNAILELKTIIDA